MNSFMVSYQVPPPKSFNFANAEEWLNWIRRFERFRQAPGLSEKSSVNQVNTLIYTMGDLADDILSSFSLSEDKTKYKIVTEKLKAHFMKKRNVIFKRAKFNQRKQEKGESIDDFVTSLYRLSEHFGYGDIRNELIRDRIVVGLRDSMLSEKLQLDSNLTLETAITAACQREQVRKQQQVIKADETPLNIDAIATKKPQATKAKLHGESNQQSRTSFLSSQNEVWFIET